MGHQGSQKLPAFTPLQLVSLPLALLVFLYSSLLLTTATYMTATRTSSLDMQGHLARSMGWMHMVASSSSSWALSDTATAAAPTAAGVGQAPPIPRYRRLLAVSAATGNPADGQHSSTDRFVNVVLLD